MKLLDRKNINKCVEIGTSEINMIIEHNLGCGVLFIKNKSNDMYKLEVENHSNRPFECILNELFNIKIVDVFYTNINRILIIFK